MRAVVVGAGVFGLTSALALRNRGWQVQLLDPGPIPHPLAESTDISKVVRLDYGRDDALATWMLQALAGWRRYNEEAPERLLFETGVLFLTPRPMQSGTFEADSLAWLRANGQPAERLDAREIARRYPAWASAGFTDGYLNPQGGYARSGAVVSWLAEVAARRGVDVRPGVRVAALMGDSTVTGVRDEAGSTWEADVVVVAAGSWTGHLLPHLQPALRSTGQPVVHLRPTDPGPFLPARFPVFCADIARTGRYGFPVGRDGVVKIGHHGPGRPMHPESPDREVSAQEEADAVAFVRRHLPDLASAPITHRRVCVYGDSPDGDFWIDPDRPGLVVAAGGSGHGFKFAPVVGELVADVVEGHPHALAARFARRQPTDRSRDPASWREEARAVD